ncbi:hypothetical protein PM082_001791 [Marasmius tenuissimus]|nr:hypothetical protein PM082_001791 [Marasmius tenuissimus]
MLASLRQQLLRLILLQAQTTSALFFEVSSTNYTLDCFGFIYHVDLSTEGKVRSKMKTHVEGNLFTERTLHILKIIIVRHLRIRTHRSSDHHFNSVVLLASITKFNTSLTASDNIRYAQRIVRVEFSNAQISLESHSRPTRQKVLRSWVVQCPQSSSLLRDATVSFRASSRGDFSSLLHDSEAQILLGLNHSLAVMSCSLSYNASFAYNLFSSFYDLFENGADPRFDDVTAKAKQIRSATCVQ